MSLKHHRMQLPREVIVGKGVVRRIAEVTRRLGFGKSALIVTGSITYDIAAKTVKELLERERIEVQTFIAESATMDNVRKVQEQIAALRPQVVLAVGAGTKIDVAKLSSTYQNVPFISIPTTASHDGVASPLSSIRGSKEPYSVMAQAPLAIIADTEIIMHAPTRHISSGAGDVLAKFTSVKDWKLAYDDRKEYYGDYAASLALMSAKLVMQNAESIKSGSEEGLRVLLEALISCGVSMSIAGSSRPCSGSEHLFSHSLDMIEPNQAMHGEKCAVGTIMMAYLHKADWRRIMNTIEALGAPTDAEGLGIEQESVIEALELSSEIRPDRYTILNKLNLSREDYKRLAEITKVV